MASSGVQGEQIHILVFELAGQLYGVDVDQVEMIVQGAEEVPCMPGDVPLCSFAQWLGLEKAPGGMGAPGGIGVAVAEAASRVLLARSGETLRGFLVGAPKDIVTLAVDDLYRMPALIRQVMPGSPLWGVGRLSEGLVLLVDVGTGGTGVPGGMGEVGMETEES